MSDNRLMIVTCEYRGFPCSSFVCNGGSDERYYVGNPYSGGLHNFPIFCKDCIDHLVSHLPSELSPEGAAIESRLRAEISLEYDQVLKKRLAEEEKRIRDEVMLAQLIEQFAKPELKEAPVAVVEEEATDNAVIYRCLDCGSEFENASKLKDHQKTHEAAPKNKGGRPPKAKA